MSQEVVWGGERVAEPGDMPLMWRIHPAAINLSLKSSTHQVLITDVSMSLFCCSNLWKMQYLNSKWSKSASKEIYLTSINWSNNSFGEEKKRGLEKKASRNWWRLNSQTDSHGRSLKFTVSVVMLVDIASYNVPVGFIFRGEKMCKFSTLCDRLFSLIVFLLNLLSIL